MTFVDPVQWLSICGVLADNRGIGVIRLHYDGCVVEPRVGSDVDAVHVGAAIAYAFDDVLIVSGGTSQQVLVCAIRCIRDKKLGICQRLHVLSLLSYLRHVLAIRITVRL